MIIRNQSLVFICHDILSWLATAPLVWNFKIFSFSFSNFAGMCSSLQIWMSSDSSGKQFQIVVDIHSILTKANIQHFLLISNICKSYFPCPECPEWCGAWRTIELVADVALTGDDREWDQRCWVQIMHARCEHSSLFTNCTIQNPRNNAQLLPTLWLSLFRETTKKLNVSFLLQFHQQIFNLRTKARPGLGLSQGEKCFTV